MAKAATLKVVIRAEASKADNKKLRKNGYIVGNISRKGSESVAVAVKREDLRQALRQFGKNTVFTLEAPDKKNYSVMIKDFQVSYKNFEFTHIDFQQVSLSEKVRMEIGLKFIGLEFVEAKHLIINRQMDLIPVKGLPQDIPEAIEIDVSNLNAGDSVSIGDIKFPKGITPEADPGQMVMSLSEPKLKEVEESEEAEAETAVTE